MRKGIDYNEVFSSIQILLTLVALYELELDQFDVKTAFLHYDLEDEIYMSQPTGFKTAGKKNIICKLKKWLYGVKQLPTQWYKHFDSFTRGIHEVITTHVCITISYWVESTFIYYCIWTICASLSRADLQLIN